MKYLITILITAIVTSAFWIVAIKYDKAPIQIVCNEECQIEKIKKQKEMEMMAEMRMVEDMLEDSGYLDNRGNTEEEYKLRIEAINADLRTANTQGYAGDKETANAILDKVERELKDILKTNFFRAEALALLDKSKEIRNSIDN